MTEQWRERAVAFLDQDSVAWVSTLRDRNDLPLLNVGDLADEMLADLATVAADRVAERHATFSGANLLAEVHRQLHGIGFASPADRVAVAERTSDLAMATSVLVTAAELQQVPHRYRRADGTSRLRPANRLYTTEAYLDAGARLLNLGRRTGAPTVTVGTVARISEADLPGRGYNHNLTLDQAVAVEQIATCRVLDVLVGPAGHREVDNHGRPAIRVGTQARSRPGGRIGTGRRGGRGARRRTGHRLREHRQIAPRTPPQPAPSTTPRRTPRGCRSTT